MTATTNPGEAPAATARAAGLPPRVVQRAAQWMARLGSDDATEADAAACAAWRAEHPDHDRAWSRLQALDGRLGGVPREVARSVLMGPATSPAPARRRTLQMLGLAGAAGGLACLLPESPAWQMVLEVARSDHRTGTGEIRDLVLPDGSRVTLDSASAIELRYTAQQRLVVLHVGRVLIETAHDTAPAPRPLLVRTREGTVRALGTRFSVQQDDALSHVAVFEGAIELRPAQGTGAALRLAAGQRGRFSAQAAQPAEAVDDGAAAWSRGLLVAERMRLADVVAEIARYRPGLVRCSPEVAERQVTGVFSLRDTDRALANLTLGLPVDVVYRTRFWATVIARSPDRSPT